MEAQNNQEEVQKPNRVLLGKLIMGIGGLLILASVVQAVRLAPSTGVMANADIIIKENILSPASYSVVNQDVLWSGYKGSFPAHIVKTIFDTENGFGATIRSCIYTSFYIKGDHIGYNKTTGISSCDASVSDEFAVELFTSSNEFSSTISSDS